jgi:serine phosphatase RsbU (regulator of sigma subunit)
MVRDFRTVCGVMGGALRESRLSIGAGPVTRVHTDDRAQRAGPFSVLLVEDDDGDAVLVEGMLDVLADPIILSWARSLAQAQPLVAGVDCVLLDLGLPDAAGLDGVRRLRGYADRVPVIVLTGQDDERLGIAAVAAGAQDYLVKGQVTGALLARTIRYAIQRRHVEDVEAALLQERIHAQENVRLERGLLPRPVLLDQDVTVTSRYLPGGRRMLLGGDFYDVVEDPDGTLHVIIGDVTGHGPDQAALGVALRIAWRTLVLAGRPAAELLTTMDQVLTYERQDDPIFASVCAMTIVPDRGSGTMHLAGHPAPLLRSGGRWRALPQIGGPLLGLVKDASWAPVPVTLPSERWAILLYTDGAIEGRTGSGKDRLGTDGLTLLLDAGLDAGLAEGRHGDDWPALLDGVIARVTQLNGGPLTDDLALLLVTATAGRRTGSPG